MGDANWASFSRRSSPADITASTRPKFVLVSSLTPSALTQNADIPFLQPVNQDPSFTALLPDRLESIDDHPRSPRSFRAYPLLFPSLIRTPPPLSLLALLDHLLPIPLQHSPTPAPRDRAPSSPPSFVIFLLPLCFPPPPTLPRSE